MRQDRLLSYRDLQAFGWPEPLIDDYLGLKLELQPQHGTEADPNGVYESNLNGFYVKTNSPTALWFNPAPGQKTGWVQVT